MTAERLIIFAKAPILGVVKSRIATFAGAHRALEIYQLLLRQLFNALTSLTNVEVRVTPDSSAGDFSAQYNSHWIFKPQGDGDLGGRLTVAFAEAFAEKMERVLIIGSDCPDVCQSDVTLGWSALEFSDLVLGPALDGGYWLIGLRKPCPNLFRQIDWSSEKVLRQTLERAAGSHLSVHLLRQLSDIDTFEDWQRYRERMNPG
jgi:rSAM/selenodomain-associated transferase 1